MSFRLDQRLRVFLLISAVAHFYLATIGYGRYVAESEEGHEPGALL